MLNSWVYKITEIQPVKRELSVLAGEPATLLAKKPFNYG
jgi:hypothetical protein